MSKSQVSQYAIDTSLWFILGRSLPEGASRPDDSPSLPPEAAEEVTQMLEEQGSAELQTVVLETIRTGLRGVKQDPSLTLSASRYEKLRGEFIEEHQIDAGKGKALWPVGGTTILKRASGSWSQALAHAGLAASTGPRPTGFGKARFTPEQFSQAIAEFTEQAQREGTSTSYQNFVSWRKDKLGTGRKDIPSGPSIRNTFGSWSSALKQNNAQ